MLTVARSFDIMPPTRWVEPIGQEPESLGEALARLREGRGLRQKEVEAALREAGVAPSQSSMSRYETGERIPNIAVLDALTAFYCLPPGKLVEIRDNYERWKLRLKRLPGPSLAIPDEEWLARINRALKLAEEEETAELVELVENYINTRRAQTDKPKTKRPERDQAAG